MVCQERKVIFFMLLEKAETRHPKATTCRRPPPQNTNPLILPVRFEIDLGGANHTLPVKALEDRLLKPLAPEVQGIEDVIVGPGGLHQNLSMGGT